MGRGYDTPTLFRGEPIELGEYFIMLIKGVILESVLDYIVLFFGHSTFQEVSKNTKFSEKHVFFILWLMLTLSAIVINRATDGGYIRYRSGEHCEPLDAEH